METFKDFYNYVKDIYHKWNLIWELTKRDFQTQFVGSYLGTIWAFINPALTIFILWIVFEKGFRSAPIKDFPFILWLSCGMIPWFCFSDGLISATYSIIENGFLVKKILFRVSVLPLVKILSNLIIHAAFMIILIFMFICYGYYPDIYSLQIIYYLFCMIVLMTGISWISSSSVPFFKDLGQVVAIILRFLFWGTPIFWSLDMLPEHYQKFFILNPAFYIIKGYRDSLIRHTWFWEDYYLTLYFWIITGLIFVFGAFYFKRLRPHLPDVL